MATATAYGPGFQNFFDNNIDWVNDTIKVALTTSTYTPNQDTHEFFSDVTNEVTGTGYTAGGQTLTTKTATYDSATNTIKLDAADVTWASSTITARYAVVYKDTGVSTTSPLICYIDFVSDQSSSSGDFTITWDANGIINVTV
ncbi:MAG: hypothetical protein D6698_07355 [Gammaproteobacteria bacterium]|nr:MAG: hypothetical protein D6698_07355 [Gammaproteobacteria bacterium]